MLSGKNDDKAKNLRACTGECDADSQCASGLKCFKRSHGEPIPGCTGKGSRAGWDYCYNPSGECLLPVYWHISFAASMSHSPMDSRFLQLVHTNRYHEQRH